MFWKALAVSLTNGDFIREGDDWIVDPKHNARLDGFAEKFSQIYNDTLNGWHHPDDSLETEQDGVYDKYGVVIVHWRNDGFIDFVAFDSEDGAKREWSDIADVYDLMPNGKTF